jgi:hypothetical protein
VTLASPVPLTLIVLPAAPDAGEKPEIAALDVAAEAPAATLWAGAGVEGLPPPPHALSIAPRMQAAARAPRLTSGARDWGMDRTN